MSATKDPEPRSIAPWTAPPAPPVRQYSFTDWQTNNPTAPPPGDRLDAEYDRANAAISQTITWVETSLNTDGSLRAGTVGESQLVSGLFDDIAQGIIDDVQPLVDSAQGFASAAAASSSTAQAAATAAAGSNTAAGGSAASASNASVLSVQARNAAQGYATTAQTAATTAQNADNHATGEAALAQDYADVTQAWAEHMPDTIPPNILAVMNITGDHWSSRWWANKAAEIVQSGEGMPDAPADGQVYGRYPPVWTPVLSLSGNATVTGPTSFLNSVTSNPVAPGFMLSARYGTQSAANIFAKLLSVPPRNTFNALEGVLTLPATVTDFNTYHAALAGFASNKSGIGVGFAVGGYAVAEATNANTGAFGSVTADSPRDPGTLVPNGMYDGVRLQNEFDWYTNNVGTSVRGTLHDGYFNKAPNSASNNIAFCGNLFPGPFVFAQGYFNGTVMTVTSITSSGRASGRGEEEADLLLGPSALAVGMRLEGTGVDSTANITIISLGTGTGGTGTYNISASVGTVGSAGSPVTIRATSTYQWNQTFASFDGTSIVALDVGKRNFLTSVTLGDRSQVVNWRYTNTVVDSTSGQPNERIMQQWVEPISGVTDPLSSPSGVGGVLYLLNYIQYQAPASYGIQNWNLSGSAFVAKNYAQTAFVDMLHLDSSDRTVVGAGSTSIVATGDVHVTTNIDADTGIFGGIARPDMRLTYSGGVEHRTWVGLSDAGYMTYYDAFSLAAFYPPPGLDIAAVAGVRSSDVIVGHAAIGFGSYVTSDSTVSNAAATWGFYASNRRLPGPTAQSIGAELTMGNLGSTVETNPHLTGAAGFTVGLWLSSGSEAILAGPVNPASLALGIVSNGSTWAKGIVIGYNALTPAPVTGNMKAIQLPEKGEIQWVYNTAGNRSGFIRSDDTAASLGILFHSGSFNVVNDAESVNLLQVTNSGASVTGTLGVSSGLSLGAATAPGGVGDLSKHFALYSTSIGFNVTGGRLNYVVPSGNSHMFVVNAVDRLAISATGLGFNGTAAVAKPAGWGAATGTATRTTFVTSSVTLPTLAEHVKALIDDLIAYGLIGP